MGNAQGKNAPEGGEGPPQAGSSHGGSGPTVTAPISINPPQRTSPGAPGSSVPGSPLTYGPQPLMEPFAVSHAASRNSSGQPPPQEFHGVAGWPQQGTLVPTVLICEQTRNLRARARGRTAALFPRRLLTLPPLPSPRVLRPSTLFSFALSLGVPSPNSLGSHGGDSVEVEGSWDNWTSRLTLLKSGKDFTVVKLLMPGVYQFKFIVDGTWKYVCVLLFPSLWLAHRKTLTFFRCSPSALPSARRYAPDQSAIFDEMGNVNNVVEVQEYVPENIEGISSFDLPESPQSSYLNDRMTSEDFVKDPPLMPQHLNLTLLNVPQFVEAPATLPRPQHVILNHIYEETHKSNENTHVLGMTYRYKSKYVTTVLYKSK